MKVKFILIVSTLLLFAKPASAGDPPSLISPGNNSTITSSKLEWQTPSYPLYSNGSPYMIQVDDQQSFQNPEKNNIYTTNNYYTPQLNPGLWYWRVKAKDAEGTWSNWSIIWAFSLTDTQSTPIPSPSQTATPSPSPTATSSTNIQTASFSISNIPSEINSSQFFKVTVNLFSPENTNTKFFLKGAFKKSDSSNYFGFTKVSGNWIKNGASFGEQYPITTDNLGNWSGELEIKPDNEDSGFTGTGDYSFKVGKYDSSQINPSVSWSNDVNIKITSAQINQATDTPQTPSPSPKISQSSLLSGKPTVSPTKFKSSSLFAYRESSVAAATASAFLPAGNSPSPVNVQVKNQKQINPLVWIGLIFIIAGIGLVGYIYFTKNAKI